jgi:hypothetical protein
MDKDYKKLLPEWTKNLESTKYNLIGGDDLDSIISCALWHKKYNFQIRHFYDFSNLWSIEGFKDKPEERLGIDIGLTEGPCVDNHVLQISYADEILNEQALNLSNAEGVYGCGISYFSKYNLNSILLSMSVLNIPLPEDIETQSILIAVDSGFQGYYSRHPRDNAAIRKYLKILGFESLLELMKNKNGEYFHDIIAKYSLKTKISIKDKRLVSSKDLTTLCLKLKKFMDIDISLPQDKFEIIQRFGIQSCEIKKGSFLSKQEPIDRGVRLYSLAMLGMHYMSTSYYKA